MTLAPQSFFTWSHFLDEDFIGLHPKSEPLHNKPCQTRTYFCPIRCKELDGRFVWTNDYIILLLYILLYRLAFHMRAHTHMMVHAHPNSLNSGNNAMQSLGTINGSMTTKETIPAISSCLTNLGTSRVRCIDTRVLRPSGSPYYQSHHD